MVDDVDFGTTLITALASGVTGGVFFGFSTFIIKALARLPAESGIATMQSINIVVVNPWFMTPFIGTAAASAVLVVAALLGWGDIETPFLVAGAVLYLVGTFRVTVAFNVPRNNALAASTAASAEGTRLWARYVPTWTAWNTVRTVAALAAAAALTLAVIAG